MSKTKLSMRVGFILIFAVMMTPMMSAAAGDHPAYIKALANLRAARWLIDHRLSKDWVQSKDEAAAVREIDATISEIIHAGIEDHKDVKAHVNGQEGNERLGRLSAALELLKKTRKDVAQRENDKFAQGLQARVFQHVDEAIRLIESAIASR